MLNTIAAFVLSTLVSATTAFGSSVQASASSCADQPLTKLSLELKIAKPAQYATVEKLRFGTCKLSRPDGDLPGYTAQNFTGEGPYQVFIVTEDDSSTSSVVLYEAGAKGRYVGTFGRPTTSSLLLGLEAGVDAGPSRVTLKVRTQAVAAVTPTGK
jgi:hypothetical protein